MRRSTRRKFLTGIGVTSTMGLAGCSAQNEPDSGGSPDGESSPLKIGLLAPFDHPNGKDLIQGAESAVQDINNNGGVLGREVELLERDTKLDTQSTTNETRRLLNQDNVDFLAGGYVSENALAIQNQIAGNGPVFMNTGSASPRMSQRVKGQYDQYKYSFKSILSSPLYASTTKNMFKERVKPAMDVSKAIVMAEDLTWTKPVAPKLNEILPDIGIEVVDEIRFAYDTSDFSPLYAKAENSGADVIIPVHSVAGATPVVQWWNQQVPLPMYGVLGQARNSSFYEEVGGKCVSTVTNLQGFDAPITEKTQTWVSRFQDQFGQKPVGLAYSTYDGLRGLFQAVESAGTTDDDPIISELESLTMTGVSGILNFQEQGGEYPHDPVLGIDDGLTHTYVQWQESEGEGSRYMIAPEAWASADGDQDLIKPPWLQ